MASDGYIRCSISTCQLITTSDVLISNSYQSTNWKYNKTGKAWRAWFLEFFQPFISSSVLDYEIRREGRRHKMAVTNTLRYCSTAFPKGYTGRMFLDFFLFSPKSHLHIFKLVFFFPFLFFPLFFFWFFFPHQTWSYWFGENYD